MHSCATFALIFSVEIGSAILDDARSIANILWPGIGIFLLIFGIPIGQDSRWTVTVQILHNESRRIFFYNI